MSLFVSVFLVLGLLVYVLLCFCFVVGLFCVFSCFGLGGGGGSSDLFCSCLFSLFVLECFFYMLCFGLL